MADTSIARQSGCRQCMACGITFDPKRYNQKTCSAACGFKHDRNRAREYQRRNRSLIPRAAPTARKCVVCEKEFESLGKRQTCSRPCYLKTWERPSRELLGPILAAEIRHCATCSKAFTPNTYQQVHCSRACKEATHAALRKARYSVTYKAKRDKRAACPVCSKTYTKRDDRQVGCSVACGLRISGSKSMHRRRAAISVHKESIDPFAVFERDHWKCQLCGKATPKRLRGKNEPRSPELDHIIPLSRGGSHTWANVQCACRLCNMRKGAKPMGQLLLDVAA